MPKRGGNLEERIFSSAIDDGMWALAYRNSDGSFVDVVRRRTYYGLMLGFFFFVLPVSLMFIIVFFAKKDPNYKPPPKTK